MVIKHVGPMSLGKVFFLLYAFIGLLAGLCVAAFGMFLTHATSSPDTTGLFGGMFGAAMGVSAIVIFPILYGVLGFIGGVIGAAVYNVIANIVGGIQVDIS